MSICTKKLSIVDIGDTPMLSAIFEQFVQESPVSVMMQAGMERIFAPEKLDRLFEEKAQQQYTRELLFSTVVGVMGLVVCGRTPIGKRRSSGDGETNWRVASGIVQQAQWH